MLKRAKYNLIHNYAAVGIQCQRNRDVGGRDVQSSVLAEVGHRGAFLMYAETVSLLTGPLLLHIIGDRPHDLDGRPIICLLYTSDAADE